MKRLLPLCLMLLLICNVTLARAQQKAHRVLFALTSADSIDWHLTLGNIANLLKGMPDAEIELVAYGGGINFVKKGSAAEADIKHLEEEHVQFVACHNSMVFNHLTAADLVEGVGVVPSGIVEVVTRQEQGWSYIKAGR